MINATCSRCGAAISEKRENRIVSKISKIPGNEYLADPEDYLLCDDCRNDFQAVLAQVAADIQDGSKTIAEMRAAVSTWMSTPPA